MARIPTRSFRRRGRRGVGQVIAARGPARHTQGRSDRDAETRGRGGRPVERIEGERPHWGLRALALALVGGSIGGIVGSVGLAMMMEGLHGLAAPGSPSQSDMALIGLVGGA